MKQMEVSRATIGRIPIYLKYLKNTNHDSGNISATALAKQLGLGEVQVRKDLNLVCGLGRPKTGYKIDTLIESLEKFLYSSQKSKVVLVGAGKIGCALLDYKGFEDYGLDIISAFDSGVKEIKFSKIGKPICPMDSFKTFCNENNVSIGIIAVPAESAQSVCELMIEAGIKGIWCFAPCKLEVPQGVIVQYENMALSLAYLSKNIVVF